MLTDGQDYRARRAQWIVQQLCSSVMRVPMDFDEDDFDAVTGAADCLLNWPEVMELLSDLERIGPTVPHYDRIVQLLCQIECH